MCTRGARDHVTYLQLVYARLRVDVPELCSAVLRDGHDAAAVAGGSDALDVVCVDALELQHLVGSKVEDQGLDPQATQKSAH